jgi:hypothetical protein
VENASEYLERRRLPRAIRADERNSLTWRDRERQTVDGQHRVRSRDEDVVKARRDTAGSRLADAK